MFALRRPLPFRLSLSKPCPSFPSAAKKDNPSTGLGRTVVGETV